MLKHVGMRRGSESLGGAGARKRDKRSLDRQTDEAFFSYQDPERGPFAANTLTASSYWAFNLRFAKGRFSADLA